MSLLITGAAGAIGSYLLRRFQDEGLMPRGIDVTAKAQIDKCDITEFEAFAEYVFEHDVCHIVHCAGKLDVSGKHDPLELVRANVLAFTNVCATMRRIPNARVIYVSSRGVYPWRKSGPIPNAFEEAGPIEVDVGQSVYDLTKYVMELIGQRYALQYGLTVSGLRLASTYGIGKSAERHGHQAILVELFHAARNGESHQLQGGDQRNDFVYYGDIYQACLRLLRIKLPISEIFNIGGELLPFSTYVAALSVLFPDSRLQISSGPDYLQTDGYGYVNLNCSKARDLLNYSPRYRPIQAFAEMAAMLTDVSSPWSVTFTDVPAGTTARREAVG